MIYVLMEMENDYYTSAEIVTASTSYDVAITAYRDRLHTLTTQRKRMAYKFWIARFDDDGEPFVSEDLEEYKPTREW